jgi:hypothetical protein
LSLRQCVSVLGAHDIVVVCPADMNVAAYKEISTAINFCQIDPWWQSTYRNFNRLKISPLLYWKFRRYDYILFYELDAFVFKDELDKWCQAGYDYIGAPWFEGFDKCSNDSPFIGVGNGGFSLRRTSAALRVLRSFSYVRKPKLFSYIRKPHELLRRLSSSPDKDGGMPKGQGHPEALHVDRAADWFTGKWFTCPDMLPPLLLRAARELVLGNNTFYLLNDYDGNEDLFWGLIAPGNFSWFKVASVVEARKFSFESNPRKLLELNEGQLPFGCHAWHKNDPEFWKIHITGKGDCELQTVTSGVLAKNRAPR